jgi:hypothetical protein
LYDLHHRPYPYPLLIFPCGVLSLSSCSYIVGCFRQVTRLSLQPQLTLVPCSRIFLPWRCRRYVPSKHRLMQDLHSPTSQKTTFFLLSHVAVKCRSGVR